MSLIKQNRVNAKEVRPRHTSKPIPEFKKIFIVFNKKKAQTHRIIKTSLHITSYSFSTSKIVLTFSV